MFHTRRDFSLAFALTLATLSSGPSHSFDTDCSNIFASIFGGYPVVCAAFGLGRMDCFGCDDTHTGERYSHLRHAEDTGQQESSEEANCGKCRDERRELLRPSGRTSSHGHGPSGISAPFELAASNGEWRFGVR